jgi:hypothetical protein
VEIHPYKGYSIYGTPFHILSMLDNQQIFPDTGQHWP